MHLYGKRNKHDEEDIDRINEVQPRWILANEVRRTINILVLGKKGNENVHYTSTSENDSKRAKD